MMLQLMAPASVYEYLSVHDTTGQYTAPRPTTAGRIEGRSTASSHLTNVKLSRRHSASQPARAAVSTFSYEIPRLTKTPWELERSKRTSIWRRSRVEHAFPVMVFKKLPREVYDCIVQQLEHLHMNREQQSPGAYLRDLYNLTLTSRTWNRAARLQMYRKIQVTTNQEHHRLPRVKVAGTSRLKLLRRTLRERPALGQYVRELHLSDIQVLYQNASIEKEEIVNQVASLVMACPNLERLVGFHIPYTHSFDRLSQALSTRKNLKERLWLISENTGLEPDEEEDDDATSMYYHAATDPLERFLDLNSNHPTLTTLILHQQQPFLPIPLTFRAVIGTLRQLPSLSHLSISGLQASSFTNLMLNALPPNLTSLRLENLPGINDKGLQRFAKSPLPTSLQTLKLINLEINDLDTISIFLSPHLPNLVHFTLSQYRAPYLSPSADFLIPSSTSLRTLHWELRSQAGPPPLLLLPIPGHDAVPQLPRTCEPVSCLATSLLASNISSGKFPSLRRIRAPHDPQGVLQKLCKPRATALLPGDISLLTSMNALRDSASSTHSFPGATDLQKRADSATSSPMSSDFPYTPPLKDISRLTDNKDTHVHIHVSASSTTIHQTPSFAPAHSRLLAQSRILEARKKPFMQINVFNPAGELKRSKTIGSFMGQLDSRIVYELRVDTTREKCGLLGMNGGSGDVDRERSLWITGVDDVVGWGNGEGAGVSELF